MAAKSDKDSKSSNPKIPPAKNADVKPSPKSKKQLDDDDDDLDDDDGIGDDEWKCPGEGEESDPPNEGGERE